ncbi:MAG: hypothetical protein C4289_13370, partial [Chloroflexota bacterium]
MRGEHGASPRGTGCSGSFACGGSVLPVQDVARRNSQAEGAMRADRVVATVCPFCGVGCNLELHLKGDQIFRVTSPYEGVVNHGNLCVKGRFGYDFLYHPRRVLVPLI